MKRFEQVTELRHSRDPFTVGKFMDREFLQQMLDAMIVGSERYGPDLHNDEQFSFAELAKKKIDAYLQSGNTALLVDAANFCMMEKMFPRTDGTFHDFTKDAGKGTYGKRGVAVERSSDTPMSPTAFFHSLGED